MFAQQWELLGKRILRSKRCLKVSINWGWTPDPAESQWKEVHKGRGEVPPPLSHTHPMQTLVWEKTKQFTVRFLQGLKDGLEGFHLETQTLSPATLKISKYRCLPQLCLINKEYILHVLWHRKRKTCLFVSTFTDLVQGLRFLRAQRNPEESRDKQTE